MGVGELGELEREELLSSGAGGPPNQLQTRRMENTVAFEAKE